jgi:hypothetical protein
MTMLTVVLSAAQVPPPRQAGGEQAGDGAARHALPGIEAWLRATRATLCSDLTYPIQEHFIYTRYRNMTQNDMRHDLT